jgi:uncharacterized protein (UPF0332 family)
MEFAEKKRALWLKSGENFDVSRRASKDGKFNAAASRFYYGMVFAARALLLERDVDTSGRIEEWHKKLIDKVGIYLADVDEDIGESLRELLEQARGLRVKGDYDYLPVKPRELAILTGVTNKFLAVIENEINGDG